MKLSTQALNLLIEATTACINVEGSVVRLDGLQTDIAKAKKKKKLKQVVGLESILDH